MISGYRLINRDGIMRAYYDPAAPAAPMSPRHTQFGVAPTRRTAVTFIMQRILAIGVLLFGSFLSAGCVYQASLSQGNLLDQEDIDQVEVGMTRGQVRFLLGTPMIDDPFHENRWDYVYFLRIGREKASYKRWISVYFDGENVTEIVKDQELRADL